MLHPEVPGKLPQKNTTPLIISPEIRGRLISLYDEIKKLQQVRNWLSNGEKTPKENADEMAKLSSEILTKQTFFNEIIKSLATQIDTNNTTKLNFNLAILAILDPRL